MTVAAECVVISYVPSVLTVLTLAAPLHGSAVPSCNLQNQCENCTASRLACRMRGYPHQAENGSMHENYFFMQREGKLLPTLYFVCLSKGLKRYNYLQLMRFCYML